MSGNSMHVVCAQCATVNRVLQDRMDQAARCGRCKQFLFTGQPITLNEADFDTHVTRSDVPLVVDFWAPWCGPCPVMPPAFERTAGELEPAVRLAKLNTEDAPRIAERF